MASRPQSFAEAAAAVGTSKRDPAAEPPPRRDPHACPANGCPLAASVTVDGERVCFVHRAARSRRDWDAVTARIRNRMDLVEASRFLRRPPDDYTDARTLAEAFVIAPSLDRAYATTRYAAMRLVEAVLIAECAVAARGELLTEDAHERAMAEIRGLSAKFRERPTATPAMVAEREPGQEG